LQAWEGVSAGVGRGFGRRGEAAMGSSAHLEVGEVHEHDDDDQVIKQFEE